MTFPLLHDKVKKGRNGVPKITMNKRWMRMMHVQVICEQSGVLIQHISVLATHFLIRDQVELWPKSLLNEKATPGHK